jgi:hypothetical protein
LQRKIGFEIVRGLGTLAWQVFAPATPQIQLTPHDEATGHSQLVKKNDHPDRRISKGGRASDARTSALVVPARSPLARITCTPAGIAKRVEAARKLPRRYCRANTPSAAIQKTCALRRSRA